MRDYVEWRGRAAQLLQDARVRVGLTQKDLAALARTTQSAVSAYESGVREPTVPVLARLIAATGYHLDLRVERRADHYRLADVAGDIASSDPGDDEHRMRFVFEFLRGAQDGDTPLALLIAAEPEPTGDARFDALLAAVAEDLSVHAGRIPPGWVNDPRRFLDRAWWVSDLPSARANALVHAPASYRRRGVMLDRHDLLAA